MIVCYNFIGFISLCEIYYNWYVKKDQNVIMDIGSCLYILVIFILIFFFYIVLEKDIINMIQCFGMFIVEGQCVEKNICY